MGRDRTALSTRSDTKELAAPEAGTPKWAALLDAEAEAACWRIVEAFSREGQPFELEVSWSAGGGSGATAKATVARSTRLCVFARALRVRAANLGAEAQRVGVTVADGFAPSRNQWEHRGELTEGNAATTEIPIPPFAAHLFLDLADEALLPGALLEVYDGGGTLRARVRGDAWPPAGVPLGGAGRLVLQTGAPVAFRAVFALTL